MSHPQIPEFVLISPVENIQGTFALGQPQQQLSTTIRDVPCTICGDKATGRHYGALACFGCKGFFRRSVRDNQSYVCRFLRNCEIDKDKRNQCRYCRLKKCIRAGMKPEAVQDERDKTAPKRKSRTRKDEYHNQGDPSEDDNTVSVPRLMKAETLARFAYVSSIQTFQTPSLSLSVSSNRMSTPWESYKVIEASMISQLVALVEWAKNMPGFKELSTSESISLLRAHACEHVLFCLARRSIHLKDCIQLENGVILSRHTPDATIIRHRLLDELVNPMKQLELDDTEYACLKALLFFDPNAKGLSPSSRAKIQALRNQIQLMLEDYVEDNFRLNFEKRRGRFGKLLLTLPPLTSIAAMMITEIKRINMFGANGQEWDNLFRDRLTGEGGGGGTICEVNEVPTTPNNDDMDDPMMMMSTTTPSITEDFIDNSLLNVQLSPGMLESLEDVDLPFIISQNDNEDMIDFQQLLEDSFT